MKTFDQLIEEAPDVGFYRNPETACVEPLIMDGSLWASRATRRRCKVLWVSTTQVMVSFDSEPHTRARKTHDREVFLRCYMPI